LKKVVALAACVALWVSGLWLMSQPMEMRGTFLGN
jgi:hypothetical protein